MTPIKLDKTDIAILNMLQVNSQVTIKEMAKRLNLSTTPIFDRIKKLEKAKVIMNYVALVDPKLVGKHLIVFINISLKDHGKKTINQFVKVINNFPEVIECHHITGNADFFLKLLIENIESYNDFILNKLSLVPQIGKVESKFSLSQRKMTTAILLNQ